MGTLLSMSCPRVSDPLCACVCALGRSRVRALDSVCGGGTHIHRQLTCICSSASRAPGSGSSSGSMTRKGVDLFAHLYTHTHTRTHTHRSTHAHTHTHSHTHRSTHTQALLTASQYTLFPCPRAADNAGRMTTTLVRMPHICVHHTYHLTS